MNRGPCIELLRFVCYLLLSSPALAVCLLLSLLLVSSCVIVMLVIVIIVVSVLLLCFFGLLQHAGCTTRKFLFMFETSLLRSLSFLGLTLSSRSCSIFSVCRFCVWFVFSSCVGSFFRPCCSNSNAVELAPQYVS